MNNLLVEEIKNTIIQGDCLVELKKLPNESVDAVVTDPPAGISFMSKEWDTFNKRDNFISFIQEAMTECLRVLKPGGHAVVWALPKTSHWTARAVEDAGFEIREIVHHVFASGFPKSLNIGVAVNKLETNEWSNIGKALDNIDQKSIMEVWKRNLNNVKIVEASLEKNRTEIGICMQKSGSAQENVAENTNLKRENLTADTAVIFSIGLQATFTKINTVLQNVEAEIRQLQNHVRFAEELLPNQNLKSWLIFTAECDVKEWLNENTEVNHKVDEALKTLRGNKKYSNEEITSVLCVALTDILKLTILNQSKTFQNLDTNSQMDFLSAINVIITEYTAENLISNTVAILKSKAVDKKLGEKREVIKERNVPDMTGNNYAQGKREYKDRKIQDTKGNSKWEGFGTALKPAVEHWILARKPLKEKTIVEQVLKTGTGGLDIDGCRIPTREKDQKQSSSSTDSQVPDRDETQLNYYPKDLGRFPANLVCQDDALNDNQNVDYGKTGKPYSYKGKKYNVEGFIKNNSPQAPSNYADIGSKSRYFDIDLWAEKSGILQFPKASRNEKNRGCEKIEGHQHNTGSRTYDDICANCGKKLVGDLPFRCICKNKITQKRITKGNFHPTVKNLNLMLWLVRLVSKEGDVVLDPFAGSGTTLIAAKMLKRNFIGIEKESEYVKIAEARINSVPQSLC